MKKILALLVAGIALTACSHNDSSATNAASDTVASAPAADVQPASAPAASDVVASEPVASAAQ